MPHRVMIVDDHRFFCIGLRAVLDAEADMEVVAEAHTARDAYALAGTTSPDVILLDLGLPGESGLSVLREMRRLHSGCRVLVLSVNGDLDTVSFALRAGAAGYALKDQEPVEIVSALRSVATGHRFVAPSLAEPLERRELEDSGARRHDTALERLSRREAVVFDLLARGRNNEAIAEELFISVRTVATHRSHIFAKLELHSLAALVRLAATSGRLVA